MFTRLDLKNFTAFKHLDLEFSPGINIFTGANGSGKTHILKLLYCVLAVGNIKGNNQDATEYFENKLFSVFKPDRTCNLIRLFPDIDKASINISWRGFHVSSDISISIAHESIEFNHSESQRWPYQEAMPVYIPVKESISFAPGFLSINERYELSFEDIYCDIVKLAYFPRLKNINEEYQDILDTIYNIIGGDVVVKGESFYLKHKNTEQKMSLVAEGFRKLALLWQLVRNGSLAKGTTLFWDEPEANLNPFLMQHVAKILILLANRNIQIFVATHNYAFLNEIDLQKEDTPVKYFSLHNVGENNIQANASTSYLDISPNLIADEYMRLYDLEIIKSLGGISL
ncbi:MAG: AAA family ATPase [Magnetococcus sp. DMHC-1]|nr:AAA family ATPase [Magnetococcales bacterium]